MTSEQRTEALRKSIQDWLDQIPGNKLVFGYADAERVMADVGLDAAEQPA